MHAEWIIPLRDLSIPHVTVTQRFLWYQDHVYIMDNHRAALWCWLQEIEVGKQFCLFHIDQHWDCGPAAEYELSRIREMSIHDYLDLDEREDYALKSKVFHYGNYVRHFLQMFQSDLKRIFFVTHADHNSGRQSDLQDRVEPVAIEDLPGRFVELTDERSLLWIVNIDLDYFYFVANGVRRDMFSSSYVTHFCKALSERLRDGSIRVLTIALTPCSCGGCQAAKELCDIICREIGIDFQLPLSDATDR